MIKVAQLFRSYIWILDTIRRRQPVTLEEICELWNHSTVSEGSVLDRKAFYRALEAIEEMFDVEIACSRGRSATYSIADKGSLRGNTLQRWMLSTMSVAGAVRESRHLQQRIVLENVPSGDVLLTEVTRAMEHGCTLMMRYQKFLDSEPYEAEVEPYCLKLFRQRWYLLAHRPGRDYLAMYALDRMLEAVETKRTFRLPEDFSAEVHFSPMFGAFQPAVGEEPQVVRLRTFKGEWNYLRTLPLHHSQVEHGHGRTDAGEEYVEFSFVLCPTLDFKFELLSHIANIEVLQPVKLRDDLCEMLEEGMRRNGRR